MYTNDNNKGITLIEVLLVVTISAFLILGVTLNYGKVFSTTTLREDAVSIKDVIDLAQERSLSGLNDQPHGVYFDTEGNSYSLYQGASYLARQDKYTVSYPLARNTNLVLNLSGNDLNFSEFSGLPNLIGEIIVSNSDENYTISLNELGITSL